MIPTTLRLRYSPHALQATSAWYIAGGHPADWLDEVATWDVSHQQIRLLVLPRTPNDRRPAGALVMLLDGAQPTSPSRRCVPYGLLAEQVYLPVEGWLDPAVSAAELSRLLTDDYKYVWHPVLGLVAFEPHEHRTLSELLTIGPPATRDWDRAESGVTLVNKLVALAPEQSPTLEMILGEGRDDIGSDSKAISDLPPSPLEAKSDMLSKATRQGKRMAAGILKFLAQQVPTGGDKPTWIDRLEDWSNRQLRNINAALEAARNKEIARLLRLLETDPAKGLRYAIPLGGDAHRGLGAAGSRLVERGVDFNLGRLGGGRPADYWDLSWEYQRRLTERYRELANREVQLGRHRRAAYIFAELMADFDAAAGALVDGRHWREAAVLYQQRLHRPLHAARCLEQGGLWTEAVTLYQELSEFEKAGDLLDRLGQDDLARQQYVKAVENHRASGDRLTAAGLLENKLALPDDALAELAEGWPHATQAVQCLREAFNLLGRLGRHATAEAWIKNFQEDNRPPRHQLELVNIVSDVATDYPDRNVRDAAADCTRRLVSRQLTTSPPEASPRQLVATRRQLLSAVSRLAPEDRLLGRDCLRYLAPQPSVPIIRPKPSRSVVNQPRWLRTIKPCLEGISWQAATHSATTIVLAGVKGNLLVMTRSSWLAAEPGYVMWPIEPYQSDAAMILAAEPLRDDYILVELVGSPLQTRENAFPPTDTCPVKTKAGSIRGMSPFVVAATKTSHGVTWLLEWRGELLTLVAIGPQGEQMSTQVVPLEEILLKSSPTRSIASFSLHARGTRVYIGIFNTILIFDQAKPMYTIEFARSITSLVGSAPKTRTRIAATFALGGAVFWDEFGVDGQMESFASEMSDPIACFTKGGHLVAVCPGRCLVYSTHQQRLEFVAELTEPRLQPLAVLPGPQANQFAIVSQAGEINVYEIP